MPERHWLHSRIITQAPMRRRLLRIVLILLLFPPLLAAVAGWFAGPAFLHPIRRELTPDLIREADASFAVTGQAARNSTCPHRMERFSEVGRSARKIPMATG